MTKENAALSGKIEAALLERFHNLYKRKFMQSHSKSAIPVSGIAKINRHLRQSSKQRNRERTQGVTNDQLNNEVRQILKEINQPLATNQLTGRMLKVNLRRIPAA